MKHPKTTVIHTETQQEWDEVSKILGHKWIKGVWGMYKEESCIRITLQEYAGKGYYERNHFTIIPANEFLGTSNKSLSMKILLLGGNN